MNIKSQKGSMILYVLIAMLAITAVAVGMFVTSANKQRTQLEAINEMQKMYDNDETPAEAYQRYIGGEIIPIYTAEQLRKIGSGETLTIDGKGYTFNDGCTYVLQNDITYTENFTSIQSLIDEGTIILEKNGHKIILTKPKVIVAGTVKNNYEDTDGAKATVPKGFTISGIEEEQKIATGLVIYDIPEGATVDWTTPAGQESIRQDYNQWVWVPVPNPSDMYQTVSGKLGGTSTVNATRESKSITFSKTGYTSQVITRSASTGTSDFREPGLATDSSYDGNATNRLAADSRFTSLEAMGQALVDDYNEMIDSVTKYGGFYIGRYELTGTVANPTEIPGTSGGMDWYNAYAACKKFTKANIAEARMVWSNQWDEVCKFLDRSGYNVLDSGSFGNYKNVTVPNSTGTSNIKTSGNAVDLETGITTYTKANNMYDVAGNDWEWTQETNITSKRIVRGGYSDQFTSSEAPASYRLWGNSTIVYNNISTRPTLYIKLNAE